jgi:predicted amidohydrolase YtcJ
VFTAVEDAPWAEAILIRGDRIELVGSNAAILAAAGRGARIIDVAGRVVVPGFNDSHDHIEPRAAGVTVTTGPDPLPDPPFSLVADSLRAAVDRNPANTRLEVIVGERVLSDSRARRAALDAIAPNHPVVVSAWSGHGLILNSSALAAAGLDDSIPDPLGGRFERDRSGRLTGLLEEYAGFGARTLLAPRTDSAVRAAIRSRADEVVKWGITSIQSMTSAIDPADLGSVIDSLDLPIRLRLIRWPETSARQRLVGPWRSIRLTAAAPVAVSGTKYVLDGTPVERLAVMRQPYADRSRWYGRLNFPPDTVAAIFRESIAANDQPLIHAVGDSAVGLVLTSLAAAAPDSVWQRLRPRIEHGDGFSPDQFPLARRLGVVVVQNPSHLALGSMVAARYGPERASRYQPLKSLLASGVTLALGSDGPLNPFLNLMFAVVHPDNPAEALTMEQAVRAYTTGSAFAEHQEQQKGRIVAGQLADLAVLSQDIFTIPPPQLPSTVSVLTLKGGTVVYDPERLAMAR